MKYLSCLAATAMTLAATALVPAANAQSEAAASTWQAADREALLREIERSEAEGLNPARYGADQLRSAIERLAPDMDVQATRAAVLLAHDYAEGATPDSARLSWYIAGEHLDYRAWLATALSGHALDRSLQALLPQAPAYRALREALPACDTPAHCTTIRVNLDRWRWMPRSLGYHYLWANTAAFRLDLIEEGAAISTHRVIVGKPASPTPSFAALVTGVTANPWWNVPQSIVAESVGAVVRTRPAEAARKGYVATKGPNGRLQVRQKPGPQNALGLVKLEMPNPYSIFLHDTPSRELFDQTVRAYSHGCVRTERPDQLARVILSETGAAAFDLALKSGENRTIRLDSPVPVYMVYFTAEPDTAAPGGVRFHDDLYRRDSRVAMALDR